MSVFGDLQNKFALNLLEKELIKIGHVLVKVVKLLKNSRIAFPCI